MASRHDGNPKVIRPERASPEQAAGARVTRVALVTGGGRGIGSAMARRLAAGGAAVAVLARSKRELDSVVNGIRERGGRSMSLAADVTNRAQVEAAVSRVESELGPIEILVNNAGRAHAIGPLWEVDPDDWWRDVEVNLRGTLLCTRAVLPGMRARGRGWIVNVATGAAIRPMPYTSAYGASKAAVVRFTDSVAESLHGSGVAIFAIAPGRVRTEMTERFRNDPAGRAWLPHWQAIGEADLKSPDEAAVLVEKLCSGRWNALSGRFFHVDDDMEDALRRADDIVQSDGYVLRLRK